MILKKGVLVVFEGIDGAGKTTQAKLLFDYLGKKGLDVVSSKEPTNSIYGQQIKRLAQGERDLIAPSDEYLLFMNDRREHVNDLINPALKDKKIIILDRYYFSTMAYQGALGLDPKKIKAENESFAPIPDVVFLLKVPPKVGLTRIQKGRNEEPNLFEREENLAKVEQVFELVIEDRIIPINGTNQIDEIHRRIVKVVDHIVEHYLFSDSQYSFYLDARIT